MRRYLGMTPASVERSRQVCREQMDRVAQQLGDGRRYLSGDTFCGWDLSFACFAAPLVLPVEYGAWLPPLDAFSARTVAFAEEMRAHPAGRFALRLFAEHRNERL